MKKITVTGKTIDEAVAKALSQLQVDREKVEIQIIEEPSKGLFGLIGAKDAVVEVSLKIDPILEGKKFLLNVLAKMGLKATVETFNDSEKVTFNIVGNGLGLVIGRRGQTLDALQYLVNVVINRYSEEHIRVVLDAENYRGKRVKTLEDLADRLAQKVMKTKQQVTLEPMNPMERKIIHTRLQDHDKVRTYSYGEEPNRRVIITMK
ncbi:protein jag [Microaerobacter geothermalis]|uniref:RNA-binding cell elongation regulator Jag/EloR n=1 Tax=Microaerobacter geothermalis TaxID=674972 RepID=UPI001F377B3A|nr:RNA-binding cell elongation regulator Jag/EloR [Microaerobacter geothermalis]MCF6095099.1 protein jag [Microaerobacter geothermalis]